MGWNAFGLPGQYALDTRMTQLILYRNFPAVKINSLGFSLDWSGKSIQLILALDSMDFLKMHEKKAWPMKQRGNWCITLGTVLAS